MATAVKEQQLTVGDVRITYLSDGYALVHPAPLYPMSTPADWQRYQHLLDAGSQLVCSLGAAEDPSSRGKVTDLSWRNAG